MYSEKCIMMPQFESLKAYVTSNLIVLSQKIDAPDKAVELSYFVQVIGI